MDHQKAKRKQQLRRRRHVRRSITGTPQRPRLSVLRSNLHIYAQLIDDLNGVTLVAASSSTPEMRQAVPYGGNKKAAVEVGKKLAELALAKGITLAAFDRGHYRFHGRVEALARAANDAGLKCCEHKPGKKIKEPKAPKEKPAPKAKGEAPKKKEKAKA
jgi:large subunit ribosomal protein L18